jgi:hypothetical protein
VSPQIKDLSFLLMSAKPEHLFVETIYMYEIKLEVYIPCMFSLVFNLFG